MTEDTFSPAEIAFLRRMAFHAARGLSYEEAAKAVIADDERLFAALCDRRHSTYVPTPDERGKAWDSGERPGDTITRELARTVYDRIRARTA